MPSVSIFAGQLQENLNNQFTAFASNSIVKRIWEKDYTVWRSEEVHMKSILSRLGWLKSIDLMKENVAALITFANEIKSTGFLNVVVLGMGGSSLCPDVCRATFGSANGYPQLHVLDSTNPTSVLRIERQINLAKTLFIVASKSGGTTETNIFYQYFYERVASLKKSPGENFIAITDGGTKMEKIAETKNFRKIFINPDDIGGRYSALSYFGLVPMALIGMDIKRILASADEMRWQSKLDVVQNSAAEIGLLMGEAHNEGFDKMTFVASPEIATFAYWVEQLVAESTGKEGKGILPIEGEIVPDEFDGHKYTNDRFFVFLLLENQLPKYYLLQKSLTERGIPFANIILRDIYDLGSQFFLWEFATAISAIVMKINPFDEPNVKESKDNTVRVIQEYKQNGHLTFGNKILSNGNFDFFSDPSVFPEKDDLSIKSLLKKHFARTTGDDYISVLAYIDQNPASERMLYAFREELTKIFGLPSTIGFGPRYLHSTGQLHKGGKPNGIFLIITADEPADVNIPGETYSFEILKNAQALGDYHSFANKRLRFLHVHMHGKIDDGIRKLQDALL